MLSTFKQSSLKLQRGVISNVSAMRFSSARQYIISDADNINNDSNVNKVLSKLNSLSQQANIIHHPPTKVPWFPRKLQDLNQMGNDLHVPDEEAGRDHPGFIDPVYRARMKEIADTTAGYQIEQPIPYQKYTDLENKTWERVYKILRPLQEKYMCSAYNNAFEKMVKAGILKPTEIPQLQDLSEFLKKETNFKLKPVTGILSRREFLNSFAMRTFCCTQYIRHHSVPEYSPEPDVIHEVLGHVVMFADPDFCDLNQEIGLLSLGNSVENLKKLGALYWHTAEFGVCQEGNEVKGYGAGLASSIGEITNFGERKAQLKPLDPFNNLVLDYPTQVVQPIYYVAESFKDAWHMLIRYGEQLSKPFNLYYNHQTNTVEVDRKLKLVKIFKERED